VFARSNSDHNRTNAPDPVPRTEALRVLIVDDDHDTAETLTDLLRRFGHDTLTVFRGLDALESVSSYAPDVVLLDLSMPGVDGFALAQHARRVTAGRTTLVAHTGHDEEDYRARARAAGITHYLVKPASPVRLQQLLEQIARECAEDPTRRTSLQRIM
jgi:CheY-like chemotaxis protein